MSGRVCEKCGKPISRRAKRCKSCHLVGNTRRTGIPHPERAKKQMRDTWRSKTGTPGERSEKLKRTRNAYWLRWQYGLTVEAFEKLLVEQDGRCAICRDVLTTGTGGANVDHEHRLGIGNPDAVRGILCQKCNTGLGMFREDEELLVAAASYLKRSRK